MQPAGAVAAKVACLLAEATVVAMVKGKLNGKLTMAQAKRKANQMFDKVKSQSTTCNQDIRALMHPAIVAQAAELVIGT